MFFCLLAEKRMSTASSMKKNHRRAVAGTVLLLAVALLAACGGGGRADARLLAVDSIVDTDSVAAWRQLQAIDSASLATESSRALYALLHQQLRYKQYLPLDTTVLATLRRYYETHPSGTDRLARVLLLTGGAMEDTGDVKAAMRWYKRAEAATDTADYRRLAQLNMRQAMIYYNHYASHHIVKQRFERAAHYYDLMKDTANLAVVLSYLGGVYRTVNHGQAHATLNRSAAMALQVGDTNTCVASRGRLAHCLLNDSLPREALNVLGQCENMGNDRLTIDYNYYVASQAFSSLGKPDSAALFLSLAMHPHDTYSRMMNAMCLMRIAQARGDNALALKWSNEFDACVDSLKDAPDVSMILETEHAADNQSKGAMEARGRRLVHTVKFLAWVIVALLVIMVVLQMSRNVLFKRRLRALNREIERQAQLQQELSGEKIAASTFALQFAGKYIADMQVLMASSQKVSALDFQREFQRVSRGYSGNQMFWAALEDHVETVYDGVMAKWQEAHPALTLNDRRLLELMLAGFGYIEIASLLNYSAGSVAMHRRRIARKMGLQGSLIAHIHQLQKRRG